MEAETDSLTAQIEQLKVAISAEEERGHALKSKASHYVIAYVII